MSAMTKPSPPLTRTGVSGLAHDWLIVRSIYLACGGMEEWRERQRSLRATERGRLTKGAGGEGFMRGCGKAWVLPIARVGATSGGYKCPSSFGERGCQINSLCFTFSNRAGVCSSLMTAGPSPSRSESDPVAERVRSRILTSLAQPSFQ